MSMDPLSVGWADPATTILALLFCGHVLADFLFQSNRMVREKQKKPSALAVHALQVGIVQGIVVLTFS